jgi:hypothetical protein
MRGDIRGKLQIGGLILIRGEAVEVSPKIVPGYYFITKIRGDYYILDRDPAPDDFSIGEGSCSVGYDSLVSDFVTVL